MSQKNFALPLPNRHIVKRVSRSLAILDSMIMPEWEYRYFSFDSKWSDVGAMASMRNGQGSWYYIVFGNKGAVIKGNNVDSALSRRCLADGACLNNLLTEVTDDFVREMLLEPAFDPGMGSLFAWSMSDGAWMCPRSQQIGETGAGYLLKWISNDFHFYHKWAEEYYEREVPKDCVKLVFDLGDETPSEKVYAQFSDKGDYLEWIKLWS